MVNLLKLLYIVILFFSFRKLKLIVFNLHRLLDIHFSFHLSYLNAYQLIIFSYDYDPLSIINSLVIYLVMIHFRSIKTGKHLL